MSILSRARRLAPLVADRRWNLVAAVAATIVSSVVSLAAPMIIGRAIDDSIRRGDFGGVVTPSIVLLASYGIGFAVIYVQIRQMGRVGRGLLFNLRNVLFAKLVEAPLEFFNRHKAGDLISQINSDAERLNNFFSQALVLFAANVFLATGAAICLIALDVRLGLAAIAPIACVMLITYAVNPWLTRVNARGLECQGALSAEILDDLNNLRVFIAFGRLDLFTQQIGVAVERHRRASVAVGIASTLFMPIYQLAINVTLAIVLGYGLYLVSTARLTLGLLMACLLYVYGFYTPIRQVASVWSSFKLALGSFDRLSPLLAAQSEVSPVSSTERVGTAALAFDHVQFAYGEGRPVLKDATFALERGRTYAFVGPTGGGKTTTASLMARLYDPTRGRVLLDGRDLRSFAPAERAKRVGFILQDPFVFAGTVRDNIVYGNEALRHVSVTRLTELLAARGFDDVRQRFADGLHTRVASAGKNLSVGQQQIVSFMRAVLREPDVLLLDEAMAHIDTITEQRLERFLVELPPSTTKVVIAHRLTTIRNADEIFFVNAGEIIRAGSMTQAVELLLRSQRDS